MRKKPNISREGRAALRLSGIRSGIRRLLGVDVMTPEGRYGLRLVGLYRGPIQGRKNVESGQLRRVCTSEVCAKGGRVGGRSRSEARLVALRNRGFIQGRASVESGLLQRISAEGGRAAGHVRWHIKRNLINPDCSYCQEASHA